MNFITLESLQVHQPQESFVSNSSCLLSQGQGSSKEGPWWLQWRKVQEGPDRPSWNIQRGHFNINKLPRFCCRSQVGAVFIWGLTASHLGQISTGIMWDDVWGHQTCVAGTVDIDLGFLACVPNMYLAKSNPVYFRLILLISADLTLLASPHIRAEWWQCTPGGTLDQATKPGFWRQNLTTLVLWWWWRLWGARAGRDADRGTRHTQGGIMWR